MAYATAQEVFEYLGIEATDIAMDEDSIDDALDAATSWIEHYTQTTYADSTATDVLLDFDSDNSATSASSFDATSPLRLPAYTDFIQLPHNDVRSLTAVAFNKNLPGDTADWETQTIGTNVRLHKNCIQILVPTFYPRNGPISVKTTYKYGTATVPAHVKRLCLLMAAQSVMQGTQSSTLTGEGGSIRVGDLQINEPSNFASGMLKSTQDEINRQMSLLGGHKTYLI